MKKILGLDLGTNSIGWALVNKGESPSEKTEIIKLGVRIVPNDKDFHGNFNEGKTASKNADRTIKRGARRNNQRFKLRRDALLELLKKHNMTPDEQLYKLSALELYELRNRAVTEKIELKELGRILVHLNQKRGYKSNRKATNKENTNSAYLEAIAKHSAAVQQQTIGQFFYQQFKENPFFKTKQVIFNRADYIREFDIIWKKQAHFYPTILTGQDEKGGLYQNFKNKIIYYQRPLKRQKHLVNFCTYEKHHRAAAKSNPLSQITRIWQQINNIEIISDNGTKELLTHKDKQTLFAALNNPKKLSKRGTISESAILKLVGYDPRSYRLNFDLIEGNKTYTTLFNALSEAGVSDIDKHLSYDPFETDHQGNHDVKGGLNELWHITYSLESETDVINTLTKRFPFSPEQAKIIAQKVGYTSDYGRLSSRANRKILKHFLDGKNYYDACEEVGYKNQEHIIREEYKDKLKQILPNSLRNPVVEQILNQLVNIINNIIDTYGKPDEVRVELARSLKNSAKKRAQIHKNNKKYRAINSDIIKTLINDQKFKRVSGRDLLRYRLWEETNRTCLYSGKPISFAQLFNGETEIEHIIPKSRSFNDSMSNKIISFVKENRIKDQATAFDFMMSKGDKEFARYKQQVKMLFEQKNGGIGWMKWNNLLTKGGKIPDDFVTRQLKDSQYIAKATIQMLKEVIPKVNSTSGTVTDFLRKSWELNFIMKEINLEKYEVLGRVQKRTILDNKNQEKEINEIKDWTKRDDHRHHAVDALIVAFTSQGIIQKLNNLNKHYEKYRDLKESALQFDLPMSNFRTEAKKHIENILISFKKPNSKVLTPSINITKNGVEQKTWVPRGKLHEETVFGKIKQPKKNVPIDKKMIKELAQEIISTPIREAVLARLLEFDNNPKNAFKTPISINGKNVDKVTIWEYTFTKRVQLNENINSAQIDKIIDKKAKKLVKERIEQVGGNLNKISKSDIKNAFKDFENNPIFLNQKTGLKLKAVTVSDNSSLAKVRSGYVATKGNHHALIYKNDKGKYSNRVVSFWEAVDSCLVNLADTGKIYPIINRKNHDELGQFVCSIQKNDLFVFDLNPDETDFTDPANQKIISKNLFRVQSISFKDYSFRHHLEATIKEKEKFALRRISSLNEFKNIHKVKISNLGQIIKVGE